MKITRNIRVVAKNHSDYGVLRTFVTIEITRPDGMIISIPMTAPMKIRDYGYETDIMDETVKLTRRDCEEIFERYILSKISAG